VSIAFFGDIKSDAPYDHFLIRVPEADDIRLTDVSDTGYSPGLASGTGCDGNLPYETGVAHIFLPAGRPGLTPHESPVITAFLGQKQAPIFECNISYTSAAPQGDIRLSAVGGRVLKRTKEGLQAVNAGDIFDSLQIKINDQVVSENALFSADTLTISFDNGHIISRGDGFIFSLSGDIRPDAPLGNYLITFTDSTFMTMTDRELATPVYPTLTGTLYPLYSAEISLSAAELNGSFRCFPNPFYPSRGEVTHIAYTLDASAEVDIEIFTITGEAVTTVVQGTFKEAGSHQEDIWSGYNDISRPVVPGTYFCRIRARYDSGAADELKIKIAVLR
jgi:hypothetical protein